MKTWMPKGQVVPVKHVAKAVPLVGVLLSSGVNAHLLGQVALDAERFCQTRFLCEKYGLPDPVGLPKY